MSAKDKQVFKVRSQGVDYILKIYPDIKSADKESEIAAKVSMTGYAPKVIEKDGDKTLFEYIEGDNFNDVFRAATMTDDIQTMELLAGRLSIFLQMLYSFSDCVMKKIDFNNFLIKEGRVIGVDFSQLDDGMPYEDLASANYVRVVQQRRRILFVLSVYTEVVELLQVEYDGRYKRN